MDCIDGRGCAVGTVMTSAFAGDAKSDRVIIKSSHVQKSKRDQWAVKDAASQTDYHARENYR